MPKMKNDAANKPIFWPGQGFLRIRIFERQECKGNTSGFVGQCVVANNPSPGCLVDFH